MCLWWITVGMGVVMDVGSGSVKSMSGCELLPFLVHEQLPVELLVAFRGFHWINKLFGLDEIIVPFHVIRLSRVAGHWREVLVWVAVRVPLSRLGLGTLPLQVRIGRG